MKKIPVVSIVLYVLAGLSIIYTFWTFFNCFDYISELANSGQLEYEGSSGDIIGYYVSSCAQYFVYAVLMGTLGWIVQKMESKPLVQAVSENNGQPKNDNNNEGTENDEYFEK